MTGADRRNIAARDHRRPHALSEGIAADSKSEGRATRYAVIPPYGARWLLRKLQRAGVDSAAVRQAVVWRRSNGYGREAAALWESWSQLRASAADVGASPVDRSANGRDQVATPADDQHWIPTAEAAAGLGCTARHVRRLVAQGQLAGRQVGRTWLIDGKQVEELVELRRGAA